MNKYSIGFPGQAGYGLREERGMAAGAGASGGHGDPDGPRFLECSFLVPIRRNSDRKRHRPMMWTLLTNALRRTFGGFSGPRRVVAFRGIDTVSGDGTNSVRSGPTVRWERW